MLLNLSNHPSSTWPESQKQKAIDLYHEIQDLAFPKINPEWTSDQVLQEVEKFENKIRKIDPTAVHIMGEMNFCYNLINRLKEIGIPCIASTTNRVVEEKNGVKTSVFQFVQFREY